MYWWHLPCGFFGEHPHVILKAVIQPIEGHMPFCSSLHLKTFCDRAHVRVKGSADAGADLHY
jgi:hypothetical protein